MVVLPREGGAEDLGGRIGQGTAWTDGGSCLTMLVYLAWRLMGREAYDTPSSMRSVVLICSNEAFSRNLAFHSLSLMPTLRDKPVFLKALISGKIMH